MASVRKVAERADVSRTTVSRVLNNDPSVSDGVRKRVLRAANELEYAPAGNRRTGTVIGLTKTQGRPRYIGDYFSRVLDGVWEAAGEQKFDVTLLNMARDKQPDETYRQFIARKGVRGLIVHTNHEDHHICRAMAAEGVPMVVASERFGEEDQVSCVGYDSYPGTYTAVNHLIGLGHTRIGYAQSIQPTTDLRDRRRAYLDALKAADIEPDPHIQFSMQTPMGVEGGASIINQIRGMGDAGPTAIIIMDSEAVAGALVRAGELGIAIPEQLSVIGFDEARSRYKVYPCLSAICQEPFTIGYEAGRHLINSVIGGGVEGPLTRTIPTTFEAHDSTGPAPR